ncbi:MAG: tyrosine-type recombinase/integrase [Thermodesulfovibrionales bacterium]
MELTKNIDLVYYLLNLPDSEGKMPLPGKIRSKQKCPVCSRAFLHVPRLGFICSEHKTQPTRFFIDIFWKGQRIKVYSTRSGRILDSYQIAHETLELIRHEIREHIFDPTKYVKSEAKEFYVSTLIEKYIEHKIDSLAPSYRTDFKRYLNTAKNFFSVKDVREIRKLDIINYQQHIERGDLSPKTVKNMLDTFKAFLNYVCKDLELIPYVPSFPKIETTQKTFSWLSINDQKTLYELIPDEHKPVFAFLMLHGCRPSEARALKCKNVNLETATITISATFSGSVYREKRKGKKSSPVTIPIHPEIFEFIARRVSNNLPEAFVFINPNTGKHYNKNTIQKVWHEVRKKAGIGNIRLYDATRHSFASNLVNSGTSIYKVSKLMGHSSIRMTERYAHANLNSLKADIEKLSLKKTVPRLSPATFRSRKNL